MIVKYSAKYLPGLANLLSKSFKITNKDKIALVNWKYFDDYLAGKTITYLALDDGDNVVSHYTNLPVGVSQAGKTFKAMICTDMCTDLDHRGQGLISQLSAKVYQEVRKNDFDFSLGFSNDQGINVDKHSDNYGYLIIGKFVRYFKIVLTRKKSAYRLLKTNNFSDFSPSNSKYLKLEKNQSYLTWRYLKKPNSEYEIYRVVEKETQVGFVVLRFIKYKCYVCDIVLSKDDDKSMTAVMKCIENVALDHNVRLIIYNVLDNHYWQTLFHRLYFKKSNNHTNYYLTIKVHNNQLPKDLILNKQNWLLMNGDIL